MITLLAIGASSALVACGGSEASGEEAQANFEDAQLEFAKCMREHGIDIPDPEPAEGPGGEGGGFRLELGGGADPRNEEFQEAQEECEPILSDAIPEGERPDPAEMRDKLHELTECLRDKGYDVPEPQIITPGEEPPDDPPEPSEELEELMDDPDFQQAQEDCGEQAGLPDGGPRLERGPGPAGGTERAPSTEEDSIGDE
jgi:hypothetical protein